MRKWNMDRRSFLRGVGAALPLPFLNLMEAHAAAATPPVRFMTLFKPNGVHPPSWNISGGSESDFRLSPMMQPFAQHRDDLLILDNMGDFGFSSHTNSTRRFLSGYHGNTKTASIDQLIADKIGGDTPIRSLELTTEGLFVNQIGCSYISYDAKGNSIPRESDPQLVFDRLFANPVSNPAKHREMRSILDRVSADAKALSRRAGRADQETLDQYLTAVRETEKRLENMQARSRKLPSNLTRPASCANLDEQVDAMLDVIALALWTDSTRCISYMLGNDNSRLIFDFLGINKQHHYLSHFFRNFSRENLEAFLKISKWHMQKFDGLLTRMKSYKDANGTLLDNSLVLYGSGMGHSDNHTATRIPIVLAGKGGGIIKPGRYVRYSENQRLGRLHLSLLEGFGIDMENYAGSDTPLPGLAASDFEPYKERPFDSWVKLEDKTVTVQGRLRLSEKLDEAKIFFVDVDGRPPVRVEVAFGDFHRHNLAYHTGTAVTITGASKGNSEQIILHKIKTLTSLFGKKPGSADG